MCVCVWEAVQSWPGSLQRWSRTRHRTEVSPFHLQAASPSLRRGNQTYSSDSQRSRKQHIKTYGHINSKHLARFAYFKSNSINWMMILRLGSGSWVQGSWGWGRMEGGRTSAWLSTRGEEPCGRSGEKQTRKFTLFPH